MGYTAGERRTRRREEVCAMGHALELTEDEYMRLEAYARQRGRTPHEIVAEWLVSVTTPPAQRPQAEEPSEVSPPTEEELRQRPLLALAGSLALNDPRLATNF